MTKRIIALFLMCILAIPLLAIPASATGAYDADIASDVDWMKKYLYDIRYDLLPTLSDDLGEWLGTIGADMRDRLDLVLDAMSTELGWLEVIAKADAAILDYVSAFKTEVATLFGNLQTTLNNWYADAYDWYESTYTMVYSKFDSVVEYLEKIFRDSSSADDEFNNALSTEITEFDDAMEELNSATMPTVSDDMLAGMSDYVGNTTGSSVARFYATFIKQRHIYAVFFLALTLSLISYAVFGKR